MFRFIAPISGVLLTLLTPWQLAHAESKLQLSAGFEARASSWKRSGIEGQTDARSLGGGVGLTWLSGLGRLGARLLVARNSASLEQRGFRLPQGVGAYPIGTPEEAALDLTTTGMLSLSYELPIPLLETLEILPFLEATGGFPLQAPAAGRPRDLWLDFGGGAGLALSLLWTRFFVGARAGYRIRWISPEAGETVQLIPGRIPIGVLIRAELLPPDSGFYMRAAVQLLDQRIFQLNAGWQF